MKISASNETLKYFKETRGVINELLGHTSQRNKTLKITACIASLKLLLMRVEAALNATISGSGDDLATGSVLIQRNIYDPILEYWIKELIS